GARHSGARARRLRRPLGPARGPDRYESRRRSRARRRLAGGEESRRGPPRRARAPRRVLRASARAQRGAARREPERRSADPRVHGAADVSRSDRDEPYDGVRWLRARGSDRRAARRDGGAFEDGERSGESARADLQARVAARLAAARDDGGLGRLRQRRAAVPEVVRELGDHRHALLAVAGADQHGARRREHRQGFDERRARAPARLDDEAHEDRAAVGPAADLHGAAPVARRRLDGADRRGDACAEPGPREVRRGRAPERLLVVARAHPRRRAHGRAARLPARPRDACVAVRRVARGGPMSAAASAAPLEPLMKLEGVAKSYGGGKDPAHVLADVNLEIAPGELVAIVGFSGSGKTTLVSLMAGLETPSEGRIVFDGRPVSGPGPERGGVFQSYSLMPWRSVEGNVALAVDAVFPQQPKRERKARVREYVEMVGLAHARTRKPEELSGGMRQRVAFARALAQAPQMLLLGEPLSALDALTRAPLQDEIAALTARDRKTVVLITNDVDEAILLADRIVPLTPGPRATLGESFDVALPRPRDRAGLEDDPEFRRLRRAVTRYLLDAGRSRTVRTEPGARGFDSLPDVTPIVPQDPPSVCLRAARTRLMSHYVEFFEVSQVYPTREGPLSVVDGFNLRMHKGEFVSLIGHSGCGKSTVLSMAAGL